MIAKSTGYTSSDGKFHSTLKGAQRQEVVSLINNEDWRDKHLIADEWFANQVMKHAEKLLDILTMKPNSLPKARKINGGTKKRTPKHIADQNTLPLEAK